MFRNIMRAAMHAKHLNRPASTLLPSIRSSTTCFSSFKRARAYSTLPRLINKNPLTALTAWNRRSTPAVPCRAASSFTAADIAADVGIMVEGEPKNLRYVDFIAWLRRKE
jgi:hypothetical protein